MGSDPETGGDGADTKGQRLPEHAAKLLLDSIIPYQINRLSHRMNRLLDQDLRQHGLSISSWRVMAVLDFNAKATVNELSRYAMIEQSTLSRMLQRMEANDLIRPQRDKRDGRLRAFSLTPFGRQKYEDVRDVTLKHVGCIIEGFSNEERSVLMDFIGRMQKNVEQLDQAATPQTPDTQID